jgi:2'-5' RNA ligase
MSRALYFLAILPPGDIQDEVTRFKEYAADHFNTEKALNSPPHITLFPPFKLSHDQYLPLENTLRDWASAQHPLEVTLADFDHFGERVIFVHVKADDALVHLQASLAQQLASAHQLLSDRPHGFHAHLTVAFKDLKRSVFPEAWNYYAELSYSRIFTIKSLVLLKHNGKKWVIFKTFAFSNL